MLNHSRVADCIDCGFEVSKLVGGEASRKGYFTGCGHLLCSNCVPRFEIALKANARGTSLQCPLCSKHLTHDYLIQRRSLSKSASGKTSTVARMATTDNFAPSGVSSKAAAVVNDVERDAYESKRYDTILNRNRKTAVTLIELTGSIIFSCWTRSLDLIGQLLSTHQISYVRLDGSQSTKQRQQVLDDFHSDPYLRVFDHDNRHGSNWVSSPSPLFSLLPSSPSLLRREKKEAIH